MAGVPGIVVSGLPMEANGTERRKSTDKARPPGQVLPVTEAISLHAPSTVVSNELISSAARVHLTEENVILTPKTGDVKEPNGKYAKLDSGIAAGQEKTAVKIEGAGKGASDLINILSPKHQTGDVIESNEKYAKLNSGSSEGQEQKATKVEGAEEETCDLMDTSSTDQQKRHHAPRKSKNLQFYRNEIKCEPDGLFIDQLHKKWNKKYEVLERNHGFIQWLFPIREQGLNYLAQELQDHEIRELRTDSSAQKRLVESFRLLLDFYGLQLIDDVTGAVKETERAKRRLDNLNTSSHNWLRVTRIVKCLVELGREKLALPWLEFLVQESHGRGGRLPRASSSCTGFWILALSDKAQRQRLLDRTQQLRRKNPKTSFW